MSLFEGVYLVAWYLFVVGLLKIVGAWLLNRDAGSAIGNGIAWFVPGLA